MTAGFFSATLPMNLDYQLTLKYKMYIFFDIGGTNSRFGSSIDGTTIDEVKIIPTAAKFDDAILAYQKVIAELANEKPITGIAGGLPGVLNPEKTSLTNAPHLHNFINKPIAESLARIGKCPVFLENDTAMAALGEASSGLAKNYRIVAYLAVGTGIGGCRIVHGKIDAKSQGFEPGHMLLGQGKELESLISGSSIVRKYHKQATDLDDVFWHEFEEILALGLHNLTVMWSPDIIVLGGGVIINSALSVDRIMLNLYQTLTIYPKLPKVIKATLGDHSALHGSLYYLRQKLETI